MERLFRRYLKYKHKYLNLKILFGGNNDLAGARILSDDKDYLSENTELEVGERHTITRTIASGGLGIVSIIRNDETGQEYILKVPKRGFEENARRECRFLSKMKDKIKAIKRRMPDFPEDRYIKFRKCFITLGGQSHVGLITELAGAKILKYRHSCDVIHLFNNLYDVLQNLYLIDIAHLDIKRDNIMLTDPKTCQSVVLIDFGSAQHIEDYAGDLQSVFTMISLTGSIVNLFPFIYSGESGILDAFNARPEDKRSVKDLFFLIDLWAVIAVVYYMMSGHHFLLARNFHAAVMLMTETNLWSHFESFVVGLQPIKEDESKDLPLTRTSSFAQRNVFDGLLEGINEKHKDFMTFLLIQFKQCVMTGEFNNDYLPKKTDESE